MLASIEGRFMGEGGIQGAKINICMALIGQKRWNANRFQYSSTPAKTGDSGECGC